MRKARLRRRTSRHRARPHIGPSALLFFATVVFVAAGLAIWIEDRYHKAANAYQLYLAEHPLKPGEKPPHVDWLTDKVGP